MRSMHTQNARLAACQQVHDRVFRTCNPHRMNDVALYGEFYGGLAERIKDQLLSLDHPQTFQQRKVAALKCDTRYWECQGKKDHTLWSEHAGRLFLCTRKIGSIPTSSSDAAMTSHTNPGIGWMASSPKRMGVPLPQGPLLLLQHHHQLACLELLRPDCRNSQHPKPAMVGCATFTVTGEPEATILGVVEDP